MQILIVALALAWMPPTLGFIDVAAAHSSEALTATERALIDTMRTLRVVEYRNGTDSAISVSPPLTRSGAERLLLSAKADPTVDEVALDVPVEIAVEPADTTRSEAVTDPLRGAQWALDALDSQALGSDAQGNGVTVAVLDTGVDATHEDLEGHVLPGAEFLDGNTGASTGTGQVDPHGHGTHVAGIIAAQANNGRGIAGLAPQAEILPIRVLGADGKGWSSDVARGIIQATDLGAQVINLSLSTPNTSAVLHSAVTYATNHGTHVVAAAGNARATDNAPRYPAAYQEAIAVAATTSTGVSASYSSTGDYIDVAAPGSSILSTSPGDDYTLRSGTSMAAPYVSATLATCISARPTHSAEQRVAAMTSTAADLGTPGWDREHGSGLIQPARIVNELDLPVTPDNPVVVPPVEAADKPSVLPTTNGPSRVRFVHVPRNYRWGEAGTIKVIAETSTGAAIQGKVRITLVSGGVPRATRLVTTNNQGRAATSFTMRRSGRFTAQALATDTTRASAITWTTRRHLVRPRTTLDLSRSGAVRINTQPGNSLKVVLERRRNHQWRAVSTGTTYRGTLTLTPPAPGRYRIRIPSQSGLAITHTRTWQAIAQPRPGPLSARAPRHAVGTTR